MDKLNKTRAQIDRVDRQMAALFEQRMALAADIAAQKKAAGMPVLDTERQKEVIVKNAARLKNRALTEYYTRFLSHLMGLSRQYQARLMGRETVACAGKEKENAHQVLQLLFPGAEALRAATVEDVFTAVETGAAGHGVVPFETDAWGESGKLLECLFGHQCCISGMVTYVTRKGISSRFAVLGHALPKTGAHLALVVTMDNQVGQLAGALETIADAGFEVEVVKNRATKKKAADASYYIELAMPDGDAEPQRLLEQLEADGFGAWVLGRWARQPALNEA